MTSAKIRNCIGPVLRVVDNHMKIISLAPEVL
jgi:ribosomal protein L14